MPGGGAPTTTPSQPSGEIHHDTFFQMSIPDAAEKYLTLAKKTKATAEVAEALLKGGLKSAAKNFPAMVNTILSREARFVRVNSEWGLSAWYPGMRKSAGRKQAGHEEEKEKTNRTISTEGSGNGGGVGFTEDSLRGRVLNLIRSEPEKVFDAKAIASRLEAKAPSINAALSTLVAGGLIARPEKGRYQAK